MLLIVFNRPYWDCWTIADTLICNLETQRWSFPLYSLTTVSYVRIANRVSICYMAHLLCMCPLFGGFTVHGDSYMVTLQIVLFHVVLALKPQDQGCAAYLFCVGESDLKSNLIASKFHMLPTGWAYEYSSVYGLSYVTNNPVFSRLTNLESNLIDFFTFLNC